MDKDMLGAHQADELLRSLERVGLNPALVQKVIVSKDNVLAAEIVDTIRGETSFEDAAQIMGSHFFDPEQLSDSLRKKLFGVTSLRPHINRVPFSERTLRLARNGSVLVPFPCITLDKIIKILREVDFKFNEGAWKVNAAAMNKIDSFGWKLISLKPLPIRVPLRRYMENPSGHFFQTESTPSLALMTYAMAVTALSTGKNLFEGTWFCTRSSQSEEYLYAIRNIDLEIDVGGVQVDQGSKIWPAQIATMVNPES